MCEERSAKIEVVQKIIIIGFKFVGNMDEFPS